MTSRRAGWVAAAWVVGVVVVAAADPIKVTPLVVSADRVFASFAAPGAFDADAQAVMKSGLLLTFTYSVELRRPTPLWFDATLGEVIVAASVKHDTLTGRFQVSKTEAGRVVWSESTDAETDVRTWMTQFEKIPLDTSEALVPNGEYYMRVQLQAHPRRRVSMFPWGRDDGTGRADFTYIR
jgi:hypothetical protein